MLIQVPPLVSCIMPTAGRRQWVPQAIRYFLGQDYPNRELVIIDDREGSVEPLVPNDARIRYKRLDGSLTLGAKRNLCVDESRGDLILHWDDDDWFAAHRISYQVDALLRSGAEVCGLSRMLFHEPRSGRTWLYEYPTSSSRRWLAGGSLLYTRTFWKRSPFPDVQVASDTAFIWSQPLNDAFALEDYKIYVAIVHHGNTSQKLVLEPNWTSWNGDLRGIVGDDMSFYDFLRHGGDDGGPARVSSGPLRIAYLSRLLSSVPDLRCEIAALCDLGHEVFIYTPNVDRGVSAVFAPRNGLITRQIDCTASLIPLIEAARADRVEHVYGGLTRWEHSTARTVAEALGIPFTISVSNDSLIERSPTIYGTIASSPSCVAVIAETASVEEWLVTQCGVERRRIERLSDAALFARLRPLVREDVPGLIDVIVPHYDCNDYLARCLESVAVQTYNFVRVTIVDDGSRDCNAARAIAAAFKERLPVRFIAHATNRGASAARNTGASDRDGEYFFFLDADCLLYPDALRTLLETLLTTPAAAYAYGGFRWGDRLVSGQPFDAAALLSRNYISTMSLIRRKAFPGFDESLKRLQDWDLWLTMLEQGLLGVWCDQVLFETPMRATSISSGEYSWEEAATVLRRKHGGSAVCET